MKGAILFDKDSNISKIYISVVSLLMWLKHNFPEYLLAIYSIYCHDLFNEAKSLLNRKLINKLGGNSDSEENASSTALSSPGNEYNQCHLLNSRQSTVIRSRAAELHCTGYSLPLAWLISLRSVPVCVSLLWQISWWDCKPVYNRLCVYLCVTMGKWMWGKDVCVWVWSIACNYTDPLDVG